MNEDIIPSRNVSYSLNHSSPSPQPSPLEGEDVRRTGEGDQMSNIYAPRNNSLFKQPILISGIVAIALILAGIGWTILQEKNKRPAVRAIEFTEKVRVSVPKGSRDVRIWMPIPVNDAYQTTEIKDVESPTSYRIVQDQDFGNRLLYFESAKSPIQDQNMDIKVLYKIVRREQRVLDSSSGSESLQRKGQSTDSISDFLKSRGLELVHEKIKKISAETTKGIDAPLQKARALYNYVFAHMQYDKSGTGWGRGDSVYACDIGKGNCTDFHSLFITLARASQIPARFQMGISLPKEQEGKPAGEYHCWAEFYIDGKGWIPVDISEAWKQPEKADYYFGTLDENRILVSMGREIRLPHQKGAALNYLARPYAEADGKPVVSIQVERSYKNIKGGKRT